MSTRTTAPFVRLTVLGPGRTADLVLPTDQPAALLMPQLLDLLGERGAPGRYVLTTLTGVLVDPNRPLADSGLTDGTAVRLGRSGEEAAAPLVYDVVDATDATDVAGRWTPRARAWVLAVLGAALVGTAIVLVCLGRDTDERPGLLALACGVLLVAAAGVRAAGTRLLPFAWSVVGLAAGLGLGSGLGYDGGIGRLLGVGLVLGVLFMLVAGHCAGRLSVAGSAAGVTLLLAVVWGASWWLTGDLLETAGVAGTGSLLVVGLLPRIALTATRLFRLDGQVMSGSSIERRTAVAAVTAAHWSLAATVGVVAASFAAAGWLLGRRGGLEPWPLGLTAALTVGWALRARHFPLAAERLLLWLAALAPPLGLAVTVTATHPVTLGGLAAAVALAGTGLALLGTRTMSDYTGAQMRRTAQRLESVAVLLVLPLLVGVFGVYGDLLTTFSS